MTFLRNISLAGCVAFAAAAQVPGIISYQGRVTSGGVDFNGAGQFKFALVSPPNPGVTTFWSNDGTSVDGSEPSGAVSLQVTDGLFTVLLGDAGLPNMQIIPSTVFANPDVRLRLWFNDGVNGWAGLTPDQRITAVGYALRAAGTPDGSVTAAMVASNAITATHLAAGSVGTSELAGTAVTTAKLADDAVTSAKLADSSITAAHLGAGVVTASKLASGSVSTEKLANGAVTAEKLAAGAVAAANVANNSIGSEQIADTLRLRDLDVENADGLDRVALGVEENSGVLAMNHGGLGRFLDALATTDGGFLRLYDKLGGEGIGQTTVELGSSSIGGFARVLQDNKSTGVQLNGQNGENPGGAVLVYRETGLGASLLGQSASGGSELSLRNGAGTVTAQLAAAEAANNTGAQLRLRRHNGITGLELDGQFGTGGGQISVRNFSGTETVEILGNETSDNQGGQVTVKRDNEAAGLVMDGQVGSGGGAISVYNAAGQSTIALQGTEGSGAGDGAGQIIVRQPDGQNGVIIDGEAGDQGGQIVVGNAAGQTRINMVGQQESGGGYIGVRDASGTVTAQISGAEVGADGAQISLARANGTKTVYLDAQLGTGGGSIRLAKSDGTIPIKLDASAGGGGRVTTQVLEITGGSDLSEQFDIRTDGVELRSGMLVCIDDAKPGQLAASNRSYDRTVAGIISGAGNVQTGLLMGQQGSVADGRYPVALTGRVYCLTDATTSSIRPGDLLTTSDRPGHAMKATDPDRAQGAIIGKAMTPLEAGQGLVLVLVSLQ